MIEISLRTALALYGGFLLAGAFAIWLYTETVTHRAYKTLERQFVRRCAYCAFVYLDEDAEALSKCPRCESLNTTQPQEQAQHAHQKKVEKTAGPEDRPRRNPSRQKRPRARTRGPRRRR